jgi:hypothetical protein
MQVDLPPVADFTVGTISVPSAATAGNSVSITYTVNNPGNAEPGSWYDALYLSMLWVPSPESVTLVLQLPSEVILSVADEPELVAFVQTSVKLCGNSVNDTTSLAPGTPASPVGKNVQMPLSSGETVTVGSDAYGNTGSGSLTPAPIQWSRARPALQFVPVAGSNSVNQMVETGAPKVKTPLGVHALTQPAAR